MNWFEQLGTFFQVVLIIAGSATIIMIIQLIMLLIGFGGGSDVDCTDCGDINCDGGVNDGGFLDLFGLKVLTIRNLFVFLAMGGWSMILIYELSNSYPLSISLGVVVGILFMFICAFAMKKATELQSEGNIDSHNALGKIGSCYLAIPSNHTGLGKISVVVQNRLIELDAMTNSDESIPTGAEIKVVEIKDSYVIVEKNSAD